MTPPYFHDGSVRSLPEAVRIMAKVQLGRALSDQDTADIVAFSRESHREAAAEVRRRANPAGIRL